MIISVLTSVVLAHTPMGFYHTCPHTPIHVHDPNVSQVFYIDMHPYCNYTFTIDGCVSNTLLMGRFRKTHPLGWMEIDGVRYTESILEVSGEPFTTTPLVLTVELKDQHACTVTLGGEEGEAYFVSGIDEDWWLFLTVPYYAYRVQWQWAYAQSPVFVWPAIVLAAIFFFWPPRPSRTYTVTAILCMITTDIVIPNMAVTQHVPWTTSGRWTGVFVARILYAIFLLWLVWKCETPHVECDRVWMHTLNDVWCMRLFALLVWLMGCALAMGFYITVPLLYWRYTR